MANLITTYDTTLKEKIFMLRGEEAYARSTDTVLEEILHNGERRSDWNSWIDTMRVEVRIDVLRDIGASYVTLYDNDEAIAVFDFDTNTHAIELVYDEETHEDNRLKLSYGVEHNIYAKYMGNNHCMKSKSKVYTFNEPLPVAYESSLEFIGFDTIADYENKPNFQVKLSSEGNYDNQDIQIYVDDILTDTVQTDSYGYADVSLNPSDGLHEIYALFQGDGETIAPCDLTEQLSMNYQIETLSCPDEVINKGNLPITIQVKDYFNNPKSDLEVDFSSLLLITKTTDNDGCASVNLTHNQYSVSVNQIQVGILIFDQYVNRLSIPYYNNVSITFSALQEIVTSDVKASFVGRINNLSKSVTVNVSNVGNVTTDQNGYFYCDYIGSQKGIVNITASYANINASTTIEDVIKYWNRNGYRYGYYYESEVGGYFTSTDNGYMFVADGSSSIGNLNILDITNYQRDYQYYEGFKMKFDILNSSTNMINIDGQSVVVSNGDTVEVEYLPAYSRINIYVNNVDVSRYHALHDQKISIGVYQSHSLTFNNLKIWRSSV